MTGAPTEASSAGYDDALFDETIDAEARHYWYRARREVIAAALDALEPPARVAEVGCGNGNVLAMVHDLYPGALVVGYDTYRGGLVNARRTAGIPVVQGRIDALPAHRPFDLLLMCDVLEHIDDDSGALAGVYDALRPGGHLLLTVPAHPALWSDFDVASHHCRRYDEPALRSVVEGAGFDVRYVSPFMSLLYPVARVRRRSGGGPVDDVEVIRRELRVPTGLNAVLYRLLRQEARVVRRGRRLPMGTSLLALAGKRS